MARTNVAMQQRIKAVSVDVARRMKAIRNEVDELEKNVERQLKGITDPYADLRWADLNDDEKRQIAAEVVSKFINLALAEGANRVVRDMDDSYGMGGPITQAGIRFTYVIDLSGNEIKMLLVDLARSKEPKED